MPVVLVAIVPLRAGAGDDVRRLLDAGPPFDPGRAGIERQEVFLTAGEVVFVLETHDRSALEELLADPKRWGSGEWQALIAGPPRLGEVAYSWTAPDGVFFAPTPGPGDSDGGDVYAPNADERT